MQRTIQSHQRVYFASDQHLGAPTYKESRERETLFIQWLDQVAEDGAILFLMGDLFDFWFEYQKVVPKGFVRTLGKLAQLADTGLEIHYFVGNHDLWMRNYFMQELGIPVYHKPQEFTINNKQFLIGHGDGLGPGDKGYKRMKKLFVNPLSKWLFRWLHPDIGVRLAQYLSVRNRLISGDDNVQFQGAENEWLAQYCHRKREKKPFDFFLFGHRHLPLEIPIGQHALYVNTGDWIHHFTYAVFDGQKLTLEKWKPTHD
jgi:UDP-2,3-diacylglucosamine hydrolase